MAYARCIVMHATKHIGGIYHLVFQHLSSACSLAGIAMHANNRADVELWAYIA